MGGENVRKGVPLTIDSDKMPATSTPHPEKTFAFQIYMKHRDVLKGFFHRVLMNREDVSDAMQDVYLRLVQQKDLQHTCRNPRAYLFRMATNLLNDSLRKKYTRSLDMHVSHEDHEIRAPGASPEDSLVIRQQLQVVQAACRRLTEKERRAFFMHRVNKMTYAEIAVELDVSERTVRRWVVQVLSYLQEQLKASVERDVR